MTAGIMQEIRTLLSEGRSSRDVIDAGYAPGTVYKVQRNYRQRVGTLRSAPPIGGDQGNDQEGGFDQIYLSNGEIPSWVWHPATPMPCPDCGEKVDHWDLCRECDRFVPSDCGCVKRPRGQVAGFGLNELLNAASRAATRTARG